MAVLSKPSPPPYDLDDTGPVIRADWIGRGITYNTLDSIPARLHHTINADFTISEELESYFFPFPHLPLNHIVDWTIPPFNTRTDIPPSSFFSSDQANEEINTSNLQHIQVPARQVLAKLFKTSRQAWLDGARSVVLAYHTDDSARYPLSLVGFWLQLYNLMRDTIDPWTRSAAWVQRQQFPTAIQDAIEDLFANVQWSGYLRSFTESPPLASLTKILSDEWLDDTHITHLLDLLDHHVLNNPDSDTDLPPFVTVPPLITHDILHRHSLDRQISPRVADLEEFIHTGDVMQFTFITHVNGNHWTALNRWSMETRWAVQCRMACGMDCNPGSPSTAGPIYISPK
ncbi:hypothetical protein M407DRAFT_3773 [Tulasnella calospora MUT 4182]|uniref:Ubiquitin-like protease family profile domain-containing protein n=1 Tax=Tulasnella calospora MUT 4182 TaxID=1051891 RepID=A0A0C3LI81_9AGAM|nr:hypothetical protein M407DRAFT_3773 [Tulasnella calospora MUT 4182]